MTERVVDALEVIEIEIKNGEAGSIAMRAGDFVLQRFGECTTVGEPRQVIVTRHPGDLDLAGGYLGRHRVERQCQAVEFRNSAGSARPSRPITVAPARRHGQQVLKWSSQKPADIDQGEEAGNHQSGENDSRIQPDRSIDVGDDLLPIAADEDGEAVRRPRSDRDISVEVDDTPNSL